MKVFIWVDLEGISGVAMIVEVIEEYRDYAEVRRWATQDTNAAVDGALAGGATDVLVRDGHHRAIMYQDLHPRARLVRGAGPLFTMDGLDDTFDGVLLVGQHARPGPGMITHTYLGDFFHVRINGEFMNEALIQAALAGHFGVPVGLVTGDDVICQEVQERLPGVETVVVKTAIDREGGICLPQAEAHARIRAGAEKAVERLGEMGPYTIEGPVRIEVVCINPRIASRLAYLPGTTLEDSCTVAYVAPDFFEAHRALVTMTCLGMGLRLEKGHPY